MFNWRQIWRILGPWEYIDAVLPQKVLCESYGVWTGTILQQRESMLLQLRDSFWLQDFVNVAGGIQVPVDEQ